LKPGKRTLLLAAVLIGIAVYRYGGMRPFDAPTARFALHLRCSGGDAAASGRLTVTVGANEPRTYELKSACAVGRIDFQDYRRQDSLRLRLDREGGAKASLDVLPDANIGHDENGYHAIIKVLAAAPFLANDTL
jgi:hypothetical protein